MPRWLCDCGALNAQGLMRCPRCKALAPRFRATEAAPQSQPADPPAEPARKARKAAA